ncbi:restriction endonuclease [Paenibacillus albiflavus]|uniref:Restriction endonuclease n=1 Tax=Paenibacillus albiflavus TaxID=2545760 RepID=A0A4R4ENR5_9BACL|nr:restriction endonuclease [Paenibacillus albiflavus]TCZ81090.1 restriction endonuclease [Paenibacillus albiflavus]
MKVALLKGRNVNKIITILDYKPEYKNHLYCSTPDCGCRLVYISSFVSSTTTVQAFFRTHKDETHSSDCPQAFQRNADTVFATKCAVKGCTNPAEFEVYLYDYYAPPINREFMEQDFTCPYLCEDHMNFNETQAIGKKEPRGSVTYPYTNKDKAQGYTKYIPIKKSSIYIDPENKLYNNHINLEVIDVNSQLIKYLARFPELIRDIDPRKFEEIVAEIFHKKGFSVSLTPRTRDGGKDIYAVQHGMFGPQLLVIECKRYSSTNKVGVELVRGIYGVKMAERATAAMLVTTSYFSKDAIDFASPLKYELSLKDFIDLKTWLKDYR